MATNKNQHFVPRCYLRPFTLHGAGKAINLLNIDRKMLVEGGSVRHQCARSYFYGEDLNLERALQFTEGAYSSVLQEVLAEGYSLRDNHRSFLRRFWLLQYVRTEAASMRAVQLTETTREVLGVDGHEFKIGIREAVSLAMRSLVHHMETVDDLKLCLLRNRTPIPFVTSDDPAVLTNRWYLSDSRVKGNSFGLQSAGALLLLPLTPKILCLAYDGDMYSIPHSDGWVEVRHSKDVEALNQHQFLNCRANVFFRDFCHAQWVADSFDNAAAFRVGVRHRVHYAVLESDEGGVERYRRVDPRVAKECDHKALIHSESVHAKPSGWPQQIKWRRKPIAFSNGSGVGFIRKARIRLNVQRPFQMIDARIKC